MAEQIQYTKYEKARIIGARALQISMGAPFLQKLSKEDLEAVHYNPIKIAQQEFEKGIIPLAVKRGVALPRTAK
jgi:DNA-directed RNA polymerase subunit K